MKFFESVLFYFSPFDCDNKAAFGNQTYFGKKGFPNYNSVYQDLLSGKDA
jgi:hypothetical protein